MSKRRLRSFNDANFKKQVALIKGELPNAKKLKKGLVAFAGCNNLDEINEYLQCCFKDWNLIALQQLMTYQ